MVKYEEWAKASIHMVQPAAISMPLVISLTFCSTLYIIGITPESAIISRPINRCMTKLMDISLVSVSIAPSISPAPSFWPTIIDIAEPMENIIIANICQTVLVMLVAATTSRPLTEKHWFFIAIAVLHKNSFTSSGAPVIIIFLTSAPGILKSLNTFLK